MIGVLQNHMPTLYHWLTLNWQQQKILLATKEIRTHFCRALWSSFSVQTVRFPIQFLACQHCLIWLGRASTTLASILTWIAQLEKKHKLISKQLWCYFWCWIIILSLCNSVYDQYFCFILKLIFMILNLLKNQDNCMGCLISQDNSYTQYGLDILPDMPPT